YPISSFMFWAIDEATKAEVRSYKFIENYSQDARNEPTSTVGRKTVLVLDGQQRMTSLLIGLRGTFSEKAKGARRSNPSAWSVKTLYIDLLKDPAETDPENDSELGVTYGFAFHERRPPDTHRHHWFKI